MIGAVIVAITRELSHVHLLIVLRLNHPSVGYLAGRGAGGRGRAVEASDLKEGAFVSQTAYWQSRASSINFGSSNPVGFVRCSV
jgi:hypothetical protein